MTYFPTSYLPRLQQAFRDQNLSISVQTDYVIVENSEKQTEDKIRNIVVNAGFCPLISPHRINNNFALTFSPFKIPECFEKSRPLTGKMIEVALDSNKQLCQEVQEILGVHISCIQSFGTYSAVPRDSTEFEKEAAISSAKPDGTYRYAHVFTNQEPFTIKWLMTPEVIFISVPTALWEQHGRRYFELYTPIKHTFWFGSTGDYFITLRPNNPACLADDFWKGSIENRILHWQKEIIEKLLFGLWIDHWDCIKGGMLQPARISTTLRVNYWYKNGPWHTMAEIMHPNIMGKDPDIFRNNSKRFKQNLMN